MRSSFSLVVLAVVSALILSGCATSLTDSLLRRNYDDAKEWIGKGADVNEIEVNTYTDDHPWVYGPFRGTTPLCYSSALYKHCEARGYGWQFSTNFAEHLCTGTLTDQLDVAQQLIAKGAKVNAPCGSLGNPLSAAAYFGNFEIAELLIANKANVNITDSDGITPLMVAYGSGHTKIANLIIKNGADVSRRNKSGRNAKDYYNGYLERERQAQKELVRKEDARVEQQMRDKAASRETWAAIGTLATGVAVGNATRNLAPNQQTRMMKSSMEAVDSGDASGFTETTRQVKAERTQEYNAKLRAIEAQKVREQISREQREHDLAASQSNQRVQSNYKQPPVQTQNNQAQRFAGTSQQDQEWQRKELQAQLNTKQQSQNRNDEQLQQQANQNNRVQQSRNTPSSEVVSNSGNSTNSSSPPPKQSTAAKKTVTAEGSSGLCFSRPTAEKQAEVVAELDGRKECEALGDGWGFDKEKLRFAGYMGCTPCTGGEKGNFKCKVTQAMYNCRHR